MDIVENVMKYNFYYDESEHSRSIGFKTISADNFYDNFITVIVGWKAEDEPNIQKRYFEFEQKHIERHPNGELKSDTIQNKQLRCGFASTVRGNVGFIDDYLSLFADDVLIYISTFSKVEYIVKQLFKNYHNSLMFDMDMMKYSIIKSLVIYKPQELVDAIYNDPKNIVTTMKAFFKDRIEKNKSNLALKHRESKSFEQILVLLNDVQPISCVDWDYAPPFVGFSRYLEEKSIGDYSLTIDREGEHQKTVQAAVSVGLQNVDDAESTDCFGIRMADMMAGLLGKLMKSLCKSLHPNDPNAIEKVILSEDWFVLSDSQLSLYKKLHRIICELNNAWYKSFAGIYADDLVCLNSLLNFMKRFTDAREIVKELPVQGEYYNNCVCEALSEDFKRKGNKLPIEPVSSESIAAGYFINQRGAKVYYDVNKQPVLPIPEGNIKYQVLSVGFNKEWVPLITIKEQSTPVCYRLPGGLLDWAIMTVSMANQGDNVFPAEVIFSNEQGQYYADIL